MTDKTDKPVEPPAQGPTDELTELERAERIAEALRNPTEEVRQRFLEYIKLDDQAYFPHQDRFKQLI